MFLSLKKETRTMRTEDSFSMLEVNDSLIVDIDTIEIEFHDGLTMQWVTFIHTAIVNEGKTEESLYTSECNTYAVTVMGTYMGELTDRIRLDNLRYA